MLFICGYAQPGSGQAAWGGLCFGMTPNQAKEQLDSKHLGMVERREGQLISSKDFELQLSGMSSAFPMVVDLRFTKTALVSVNLRFDVNEYRRRNSDVRSDRVAISVFSELVYQSLRDKYGKPLDQKGSCSSDSLSWEGCSATWRAEGESVGLVVVAIDDENFAMVGYDPLTDQL
jgi:hypothetical protein